VNTATVEVVADTNIVIWYFVEPNKLTVAARDALETETETAAGRPVGASAWALVEIGYAAEKPSNPLTAEDRSAILPNSTQRTAHSMSSQSTRRSLSGSRTSHERCCLTPR
jgi:PIN domain nuclease of toxin-antitoxin system